jgi:hypothetical protein
VTACCTGNPTSTFGGGGGTKLFCSQALSATNAATAQDRRQAFAALCRTAPSGLMDAGDRVGFIPVPQSAWFSKKVFQKKFFIQKKALSRYPRKMANNLLAVVLERENDIACESFSVDLFLEISHRLRALLQRRSRRRSANDKDIVK